MVRLRTLLSIAALTVAPAAPAPAGQSDYWFTDELAPYRELVGEYRDGDADAAMAGVRAMAPSAVHALLDRVREPDTRLTGTDFEPALNERLFRTAAMLHLDVADLLRSRGLHRGAEEQVEIAIRWVNLSAREPEPFGSFRRRWFLGAALLAFEHGGWQDGVTFTDLACELLPDDVPLLTAAAWFNEGLALAPIGTDRAGARGPFAVAGMEAQPAAGRGPAGRRGAPRLAGRAGGGPAAGAGPDAAGAGGVGAGAVDRLRGARLGSSGARLSGSAAAGPAAPRGRRDGRGRRLVPGRDCVASRGAGGAGRPRPPARGAGRSPGRGGGARAGAARRRRRRHRSLGRLSAGPSATAPSCGRRCAGR